MARSRSVEGPRSGMGGAWRGRCGRRLGGFCRVPGRQMAVGPARGHRAGSGDQRAHVRRPGWGLFRRRLRDRLRGRGRGLCRGRGGFGPGRSRWSADASDRGGGDLAGRGTGPGPWRRGFGRAGGGRVRRGLSAPTAKVGLLHRRVTCQRRGAVLVHDATVFQQVSPVGDPQALPRVLFDQQHTHARFAHRLEAVEQLLA